MRDARCEQYYSGILKFKEQTTKTVGIMFAWHVCTRSYFFKFAAKAPSYKWYLSHIVGGVLTQKKQIFSAA